jgi:hypothetical protein
MERIGHNPDYLVLGVAPQRDFQVLSLGIFTGKELARERAVDDDLVAAARMRLVRSVLLLPRPTFSSISSARCS